MFDVRALTNRYVLSKNEGGEVSAAKLLFESYQTQGNNDQT